jgi:hypothetical protein
LIPAVELVGRSHRSAGVGLAEALQFGFAPADLLQWVSPWAVKAFDPAVEWWKSCFVGFTGTALAACGAAVLPRARSRALLLWLAAVVLLTLGGTNPVSAFLWARLPPLRFVRYPGNFSYLAVPALALCAAAAVHKARAPRGWALAVLLAAELFAGGAAAFPLARMGLFASAGPLVRRLQGSPSQSRYLLSPKALETSGGTDYDDWKHRLYGLTNAPYHLRAAGNFGEPLTPQANYEVMDRLYSARSASQAAALFPWTGVAYLLSPQAPPPVPAAVPALVDEGTVLWNISRVDPAPAPAYWLDEAEGGALPQELPESPPAPPSVPLEIAREREDRFKISGESREPGWVYAAEPRFPGWNAVLRTERGEGAVPSQRAFGAFQKIHVPQGRWSLELRYEPASLRWGLALTLLFGLGLAARGFRAARGWAP